MWRWIKARCLVVIRFIFWISNHLILHIRRDDESVECCLHSYDSQILLWMFVIWQRRTTSARKKGRSDRRKEQKLDANKKLYRTIDRKKDIDKQNRFLSPWNLRTSAFRFERRSRISAPFDWSSYISHHISTKRKKKILFRLFVNLFGFCFNRSFVENCRFSCAVIKQFDVFIVSMILFFLFSSFFFFIENSFNLIIESMRQRTTTGEQRANARRERERARNVIGMRAFWM